MRYFVLVFGTILVLTDVMTRDDVTVGAVLTETETVVSVVDFVRVRRLIL